jgi:hypothetical protein
VHQIKVQFCSKGVTGMIIAPAFALVSDCCAIVRQIADFSPSAKEKFAERLAFICGTWLSPPDQIGP